MKKHYTLFHHAKNTYAHYINMQVTTTNKIYSEKVELEFTFLEKYAFAEVDIQEKR